MSNAEQNRERRRRIAEAEGREIRPWSKRPGRDEREKRSLAKRAYVAEVAAREGRSLKRRKCYRFDAHVKEFEHWKNGRAIEPMNLHDGHVRKFEKAIKDRAKYKQRYAEDPQKEIERQRKYKTALPDAVVAYKLKLPVADCPANLLQAKRTHLQIVRTLREMKRNEIN